MKAPKTLQSLKTVKVTQEELDELMLSGGDLISLKDFLAQGFKEEDIFENAEVAYELIKDEEDK